MRKLVLFLIIMLLISCLFDPADILLGLKVPIFVLSWVVFVFISLNHSKDYKIHVGLWFYIFLLIIIALFSISFYLVINGNQPFEGFTLFKAYLFLSLAIILYSLKINLIPTLSVLLTILSVFIIIIYLVVLFFPSLVAPIYAFGLKTKILYIDNRSYGSDVQMLSIYFASSPMLAISICYFVHLTLTNYGKYRFWFGLIAIINIVGMFMAGTRTNMLVSLLIPVALIFLKSRRKILLSFLFFLGLIVFISYFNQALSAMLDPNEVSNQEKIALLSDYSEILNNPQDIVFGQGLGAYYNWSSRSESFVTELTYHEVFRNFGLIFGSIIILMIMYPVFYAFILNRKYPDKYIIVGYTFYLIMSNSNPMFFMSLGMLFLAVIIANIFMFKHEISPYTITDEYSVY